MKKTFFFLLLALLFCTPANAQFTLTRTYLSPEGTRPGIFSDGFESGSTSALFDFSGDKRTDIIMTTENSDGNLLGILVVDALTKEVIWNVPDVGQILGLAERDGMKLYGCADFDGDGSCEAIFANDKNVWLFDPRDNSLKWIYSVFIPDDFPVLLRAVDDFDGDNRPDLFIVLPKPKQVELWSHQ